MRKVEPPAIRSSEAVEAGNFLAWQQWISTLTPDELAQLDEKGLKAPPKPRKGRRAPRREEDEDEPGHGTCDHLESSTLDPAAALMAKEEAGEEIDTGKRSELLLLSHVLPIISDAVDARLEASLIALALKIGVRQGITVTILSSNHSLTEQEVIAGVRRWETQLGMCRSETSLLVYVLSPILASSAPGLEAEAIAKAARIGLSNSGRMEDAGLKHGVCRQAISRRVRVWCQDLGLPLPRECKRNTESYRLHNVRKESVDPFNS